MAGHSVALAIVCFRGNSGHHKLKPPCLLVTQSGHERLRIAAVQTDPQTPFRQSQIPAVIAKPSRAGLSLGEGNATT
jgi:hypothetical protein